MSSPSRSCFLGERVFRNAPAFAQAPKIPQKYWKRAQVILKNGHLTLGCKLKDGTYILPSECMLENHVPQDKTHDEKRQFIKVACFTLLYSIALT